MFLINFQQIDFSLITLATFLLRVGRWEVPCAFKAHLYALALLTEILKNIVVSKHNGKSSWLGLQEYIELLKLNVEY